MLKGPEILPFRPTFCWFRLILFAKIFFSTFIEKLKKKNNKNIYIYIYVCVCVCV